MMSPANDGKALEVTAGGVRYQRIPIKTRVIMPSDGLADVVAEYAVPLAQDGDTLFVTEKIVAITQGRSYRLDEIEPRPFATFLSKYVTKTSHGIGLGMPETMEMALREVGTPRVVLSAAVSAATKLVGRRGDFYRVAGSKARAIDGPTHNTIPPYNEAVVLGPERPNEVAREIQALIPARVHVAVVDINDFGGNILGSTLSRVGDRRVVDILSDNPLGQDHESTPLGIIRRA